MFLFSTALAWGYCPNANASVKQLKHFLKRCLIEVSKNQGNWNFDPEVPDDYYSVLMPALISRGVPKNDIAQVLNAVMNEAAIGSTAATATVIGPDGQMATITDAAASADTWAQNTAEWWENTWSGDWASGWTNWQQGWADFWSGNFF
jgi:hypothetical protein